MLNEKALEAVTIALYECEKKRGYNATEVLCQGMGKPISGLLLEPLEECRDTFESDAKAAIEAYLASVREQVDVEKLIVDIFKNNLASVQNDGVLSEYANIISTALREKGVGI